MTAIFRLADLASTSSHGCSKITFILRTVILVLTVRAELLFRGEAYEGMLKECGCFQLN